jgi:hypothetical protein
MCQKAKSQTMQLNLYIRVSTDESDPQNHSHLKPVTS